MKEINLGKMKERFFSEELKDIYKKEGIRSYLWHCNYLTEVKSQEHIDIYQAWIHNKERKGSGTCVLLRRPLVSIILISKNPSKEHLGEVVESIKKQSYPNWEIKYAGEDPFDFSDVKGEYVIFLDENDLLEPYALYEIVKKAGRKSDVIYCDEDLISKDFIRSDHFFKPDWSPDTFMSFMYTGSCVAIRKSLLEQVEILKGKTFPAILYDALLKVTEKTTKIAHVDRILNHRKEESGFLFQKENEEIREIKEAAIKRRDLQGEIRIEQVTKHYYPVYENKNTPPVSIIIPSKDNYEILNNCITTMKELTSYPNYEVFIIDNGSNKENREKIEKLAETYELIYHYEPMDFNFSKMCNIGASIANGEYLLFLNDDIEILQKDWIEILVGHGSLPYTGAVGAKLLYWNTNIIQHIGVTNLKIGPAHKLGLFEDNKDYYFGRNYLSYNYSAVTGACLLISKAKFHEVKGFNEKMKIRYNDVELGFKLCEKGYYNVVRNDVVLYHRESVSRGDDTLSKEKMKELVKERTYLYRKHRKMKNHDPFYNKNLVYNKTVFEPDYIYKFENRNWSSKCKKLKDQMVLNTTDDEIRIHFDEINTDEEKIYLEGWSYIKHLNNRDYERCIILEEENSTNPPIQISTMFRYREDVLKSFPEEQNIGLSGFIARIPKTKLKEDVTYRIGLLAMVKHRKEYLFQWSEETIRI